MPCVTPSHSECAHPLSDAHCTLQCNVWPHNAHHAMCDLILSHSAMHIMQSAKPNGCQCTIYTATATAPSCTYMMLSKLAMYTLGSMHYKLGIAKYKPMWPHPNACAHCTTVKNTTVVSCEIEVVVHETSVDRCLMWRGVPRKWKSEKSKIEKVKVKKMKKRKWKK